MASNAVWWRRPVVRGWPSRWPVWSLGTVAVALLSVPISGYLAYLRCAPLERYYLKQMVVGSARARVSLFGSRPPFYVVEVLGSRGWGLATATAVVEGLTKTREGVVLPLALSEKALQVGITRLRVREASPEVVQQPILFGLSPKVLMQIGAFFGVGVLAVGLTVVFPWDRERARVRKHGRRLRGPELLTPEAFVRRVRPDGVCLLGKRRLSLFGWEQPYIGVKREDEANHFLVMGDTGMGKSSVIRQMLRQIEQGGETAIVYDPAREYVRDFYDADRGDVVLNPLDVRMPYWMPGAEVLNDAEALTLAKSLFPDRPRENPFFVEGPRKIFAHLLRLRPSAEELVDWLCRPEEIEQRLKGTELAAMLDVRAPQQRSGVLSSLSLVADALKLLPSRDEARGEWSAAGWSRKRRGWIFLTSTGETRDALLPLISLWLDMLVLRLMNLGPVAGQPPVWFVLDELATLQRLPQLHTAVTENRKSGNPVVLGFQGRSQLEGRYGQDAEAMLSQPATKIFLRTSEPRAAKWVSEAIGEVEIERLRESSTNGSFPHGRSSHSDMLERAQEPLVTYSEVEGLPKLRGYLKSGNLVVPLDLDVKALPPRAEGFIERPARPRLPVPAVVVSEPAPQPQTPVAVPEQAGPRSEVSLDRDDAPFFE